MRRQGFDPALLARHRIDFTAPLTGSLVSAAIAVCLVVLACLNLAGADIGRVLSWVFQPLVLIGGGLITAGQVCTVAYVRVALRKNADADTAGHRAAGVRLGRRPLRVLVDSRRGDRRTR